MTQLGVYIGNQAQDLSQFEGWLGRPVDTVLGFTGGFSWGDADPGWQLSSGFLGGTGRLINWSIPMTPDDSGAAGLREAASGLHNADYTRWAQEILASRAGDTGPIYVRTSWELGGGWFPWTAAAQADPEAYKGAFQQFAASFHAVSDRFKMVWDVAGDQGPVEQWYPGDQAVDVISQDVYWNPQWIGTDPAAAFDAVKGYEHGLTWIANFADQHGKQIAISEWGVPGSDAGVDSAKFIQLMTDWISSHNVAYANYWNGLAETGYNGKLSDGDPAAAGSALQTMFANGISSSGGTGSGGGNTGGSDSPTDGSTGGNTGNSNGGSTDGSTGSSGDGSTGGSTGDAAPAIKFGVPGVWGKTAWEGHLSFGGQDYHTFGADPAWGSVQIAAQAAPTSWSSTYATHLAFDNFTQVQLDLHAAGKTALDLLVVSAKSGSMTTGAGDDTLTWVAHSDASGSGTSNTMLITPGAGHNTVHITAAGISPLAQYDTTGNGSLYNASYNGKYSTADVRLTSGTDTVTTEGNVRLVLHNGTGFTTASGGAASDTFYVGKGGGDFTGGAGNDWYVLSQGDGHVTVEDFASGRDHLKFTGIAAGSVTTAGATENGVSGLLVTYGSNHDSIFLAHVSKLAASDLVFA